MSKEDNYAYCKICGVRHKSKFKVRMTSRTEIDLCQSCFNWSADKSISEIKKEYSNKSRNKNVKKK